MNEHELKQAVAQFYDGSNAPNVTAAGEGDIAQQIITLAREHGVPLFENAELLKLLATLDIGEEIPETLYLCIAQVIAFAYKIQGKSPQNWRSESENSD
jgi:flagellar biosynthesis protein